MNNRSLAESGTLVPAQQCDPVRVKRLTDENARFYRRIVLHEGAGRRFVFSFDDDDAGPLIVLTPTSEDELALFVSFDEIGKVLTDQGPLRFGRILTKGSSGRLNEVDVLLERARGLGFRRSTRVGCPFGLRLGGPGRGSSSRELAVIESFNGLLATFLDPFLAFCFLNGVSSDPLFVFFAHAGLSFDQLFLHHVMPGIGDLVTDIVLRGDLEILLLGLPA